MPFRVTFFAAHAIICIIMVYLEKEEQILEFLHLNATFGRLEQHELHLHSGLNLICAPNESGKSTWGSFICAMLYGLSTRDRGLMADKNRFAPWSGAAMQGRMDILSDGRALTLQRDTRRANAPMGNFSCTYTGTGTPVEGITAQNAGEQLLGVPRDVWERSAFIGQNALAVSQSAELERRISSLITTGEEDASFTESYERLKKQLNRRKHNKTGQIPVLERDIAQLHQSLQELDALEQQARQAQEEVSALTQRVDGLRHQAAQQQAQIRQERINAWHRAARTAEEAQRRADILAEAAAPLPDDAALSLLEGQAATLQSDMAALTGQRSAANEARTAAAEAHAVWEAHPLYPDDAAALERRAASIAPAKAPSLLLPAADGLLLAICAVLAVVFRAASPQRWIFAGMALLAAALTVFSVCLRRRAIRQEQERVDRDRAALAEQTASYLPLRDRAAQTDEAARRAGAILSGAEESCRSRLLTLLTQVQRFAPAAADLSGAQIALSDARRSRDTLADARRTAREAAVGRDALQSQLSEEDLTRPPMPVIPIAGGSVELELSQAQTALADARSRYDHLLGRIRGLDRSSDLTDQLSQKQEELARLQQEYDAITLAMTALEQANIILKNRFSPALGARAAEIFSALTDGRYDKVLLSQDMALSAEQSGDPMRRSIRLLSQGAADQLYLAVRLAICGMVLPEEKHVPLLLDDALVSFDDRRLRAALDVLLAESEQRQILLFTCHRREGDYLRDHAHVISLN